MLGAIQGLISRGSIQRRNITHLVSAQRAARGRATADRRELCKTSLSQFGVVCFCADNGVAMTTPQRPEPPPPANTFHPDSTQAFQRRMERAPEWFCSFLAGNSREKSRLRREIATMKGSVVWLVQQRRQGTWSAQERAHLRDVMRSASSVSPYLFIWVIPGSMLLLPFMAWFLDKQRKRRERKLLR